MYALLVVGLFCVEVGLFLTHYVFCLCFVRCGLHGLLFGELLI